MATRIDDRTLEILQGVASHGCDGDKAVIRQQLDRPTYQKVNKVLEALGGVWNRKAKAHVFDGIDAAVVIGDAVSTGEYIDEKKEYQFFETPPELARKVVEVANIRKGMTVLEPSAGKGALARAARKVGGLVECVELNEKMATALIHEGFPVSTGDFLAEDLPARGTMKEAGKPERWVDERVDRVVMNPPFARGQDMMHVRRAFQWLKPGGVLVAITSSGWTFRSDRKAVEFREWLESEEMQPKIGVLHYALPDDAFKASGTMVRARLIRLQKNQNADEPK